MMPGAGALGIVMQTTLKDCLLALWRLSQPAVLMTAKAELCELAIRQVSEFSGRSNVCFVESRKVSIWPRAEMINPTIKPTFTASKQIWLSAEKTKPNWLAAQRISYLFCPFSDVDRNSSAAWPGGTQRLVAPHFDGNDDTGSNDPQTPATRLAGKRAAKRLPRPGVLVISSCA
jgi:hypothetical protein